MSSENFAAVHDADLHLLDWLRNSNATEWNGSMLNRIAGRLEHLSRENLALIDSQQSLATRVLRLEGYSDELADRIKRAALALGYVK